MLFLALPLGAEGRPDAASIHVRSNAEFAAAVAALRYRGGTIHLRRHVYRGELVVPSRFGRRLRIVGERGVIVESLLLDRTQHVTVKRVGRDRARHRGRLAQDLPLEAHRAE